MAENNNTDVYLQGYNAWDIYFKSNWKDQPKNPYQAKSEKWKEWNRGWNANYNGIEV